MMILCKNIAVGILFALLWCNELFHSITVSSYRSYAIRDSLFVLATSLAFLWAFSGAFPQIENHRARLSIRYGISLVIAFGLWLILQHVWVSSCSFLKGGGMMFAD